MSPRLNTNTFSSIVIKMGGLSSFIKKFLEKEADKIAVEFITEGNSLPNLKEIGLTISQVYTYESPMYHFSVEDRLVPYIPLKNRRLVGNIKRVMKKWNWKLVSIPEYEARIWELLLNLKPSSIQACFYTSTSRALKQISSEIHTIEELLTNLHMTSKDKREGVHMNVRLTGLTEDLVDSSSELAMQGGLQVEESKRNSLLPKSRYVKFKHQRGEITLSTFEPEGHPRISLFSTAPLAAEDFLLLYSVFNDIWCLLSKRNVRTRPSYSVWRNVYEYGILPEPALDIARPYRFRELYSDTNAL